MYFVLIVILAVLIHPTFHQSVGQLREYEFETKVLLNTNPNSKKQSVGFKISADFEVSTVWINPANKEEQVFQLKVMTFRVADRRGGKSKSAVKKLFVNKPILLHIANGEAIIHSPVEAMTDNNIIRGMVELIRINKKNGDFTETSVSGSCNAHYETNGKRVLKIVSRCVNHVDGAYKHFNEMLGSKFRRVAKIQYELDNNDVVQSAEAEESYSEHPRIYSAAITALSSWSKVTLRRKSDSQSIYRGDTAQDIINAIAQDPGIQFTALHHKPDIGAVYCTGKCQSAPDTIARLKKYLKVDQLSSVHSAKGFIIALSAFRSASVKEILDVLKTNKKVLPQLMDILGVTQTEASVDAAFKFIKFNVAEDDSAGIEIAERYLISLSISSHPDSYALNKLVAIARKRPPSNKAETTVILTIGALMKSLNIISPKNEAVLSSLDFIMGRLDTCKDNEHLHLYLKALRNFGDPSILPAVEKFINHGGKITVSVLRALNALNKEHLSVKVKGMLEDVYFETNKRHDSSARILAADILLQSNPSDFLISRLIRSLSNQKSEELPTYLLKRIQELGEKCPELRSRIQQVMKEKSVGNYNNLAQKGLSVAMANPLFVSKDLSANYGMHTELLKGGMLKTTSFDVDVFSGSNNVPLISVGAFAAGLESYVGGDSSESTDEEQEEATCGMQISLLGVSLRHYTFFTGQGELMSLVWSGAGSDPTPALQGNFLLHDMANQIVLHNGITVQSLLQGVISTDLSGSVQISLWNRNAESVVNNKGAFLLRGTLSVETDLINTFVQYDVEAKAELKFMTTLDFYNTPSRMCMEMDQPPFTIKHTVTKSEDILSVQYSKKKTSTKVLNILGRSFGLPQAIYTACRSLKSS